MTKYTIEISDVRTYTNTVDVIANTEDEAIVAAQEYFGDGASDDFYEGFIQYCQSEQIYQVIRRRTAELPVGSRSRSGL
jgi:hypothetical protein